MPIALIGERNLEHTAHRAIEASLKIAGVEGEWLETDAIPRSLDQYSGFWCVPGSPYRSEVGALRAIRFARENRRPFLGTCGGFQHALLEYARNVLGLAQAKHAETSPEVSMPLISPLACALIEQNEAIYPVIGSRLSGILGNSERFEGYYCSFGLNPAMLHLFADCPLRVCARDRHGAVRAMEIDDFFYTITLFQPERAALKESLHPLVQTFLRATG